MRVIFVSGPYRDKTEHGVEMNILNAKLTAVQLWREGWAVICPHKNSERMGGVVSDRAFLDGDLEILRRCDAIYMMRGWERSEGARGECALAKELGLEILEEA